MRNVLTCLLACTALGLQAQSQTFSTDRGDLTLTPILHATLALQWDGKTIYVDPYGGAEAFEGLPAPDLVLITDIHGDHMNRETLSALDLSDAQLVAPAAVVSEMNGAMFDDMVALANGESFSWAGIAMEATPMYNLPETDDSRHPKGRGNGYVLDFAGTRLYISGDTEDIPEMRQLEDIDIALVCMNMPYTMTVDQAAEAVLEFQPDIAIPFHYRGGGGTFSDVQAFKQQVQAGNADIEVRLLSWYPEN